MEAQQNYVLLNNEFIPYEEAKLHVSDLALQRGFGIFDYFKVVKGRPVFLKEHLGRLAHSAKEIGLPLRYSEEQLICQIEALLEKNQLPYSGVKLTLTGGYSKDAFSLAEPNFIISQSSMMIDTKAQLEGIKVISVKHQRQLSNIKTIDYLMAIMQLPNMKERGAKDVLYYNKESITECPRANFFIVTQTKEIITPEHNILSGISRQKILALSRQGFTVKTRNISLEEVYQAEEAFISSTTKNILPVIALDDHVFGEGRPGSITKELIERFDTIIEEAVSSQNQLLSSN